MPNPQVSVVIPTRNRRALLSRALATALGQRGVDVEVFVVDEGSSDGTADLVRGLGDPRVTLVRHATPQGVAAARNVGIERAHAPWIAFLDDDDFWAPDKLVSQLDAAARIGADWACAGAVIVDAELRLLAGWRVPAASELIRVLSYNCIPGGGSGAIARTEVARSVGGFDPKLAIFADWEMWMRLYLRSTPALVDRPLVGYFRHNGSLSMDGGFRAEIDWICEKHDAACRERGVRVHRERWLKWAAAGQLRAGNRHEALRIYRELIVAYRDPKSLARALIAGLWPGLLVACWSWHLRRDLKEAWRDEAESWLAPLRETPLVERRTSAAA